MTPMDHTGQPAILDQELREDALEVFSDLLQWRLAPARWDQVADSLTAIEAALAAGDVPALRGAIAELELAGPVRATRIGSDNLREVPRESRDRVNTLVHSIGRPTDNDDTQSNEDTRSNEDTQSAAGGEGSKE